jgi:hypothetical protein
MGAPAIVGEAGAVHTDPEDLLMLTHSARQTPRLALAALVGVTLAAGALAGPALAADDSGTAAAKPGSDAPAPGMRKAGGDPGASIISVL